jgi:adenine-specific DNA-methyltransferase
VERVRRKKQSGNNSEKVKDYRYEEKRKLIPEAGLSEYEKQPITTARKYAYDPHLDPQLVWAGKEERKEFRVDTVSLHIHERISSKAIIDGLRKDKSVQLTLFADPELPLDKRIEFYQHDVG